MSDLTPTSASTPAADAGTVTCPRCGAQNEQGRARCSACGEQLPPGAVEHERDDLELEESWRAAAAGGYDQDVAFHDGAARCPRCGHDLRLGDRSAAGGSRDGGPVELDALAIARDTPGGRDEVGVAVFRCPSCGAPSRAEVVDADLERARRRQPSGRVPLASSGTDQEVDPRSSPPEGATPEHPLAGEERFFDPGGPGTLRERGDLLDDEGEDIRQYTGEPVETEEGWVTPRQQNVGKGNMAGQGEWPDPDTPSAMPKGDEPPAPEDREPPAP